MQPCHVAPNTHIAPALHCSRAGRSPRRGEGAPKQLVASPISSCVVTGRTVLRDLEHDVVQHRKVRSLRSRQLGETEKSVWHAYQARKTNFVTKRKPNSRWLQLRAARRCTHRCNGNTLASAAALSECHTRRAGEGGGAGARKHAWLGSRHKAQLRHSRHYTVVLVMRAGAGILRVVCPP